MKLLALSRSLAYCSVLVGLSLENPSLGLVDLPVQTRGNTGGLERRKNLGVKGSTRLLHPVWSQGVSKRKFWFL